MASIDCMSIRGIRSFGPDEAQTIAFARPLTVIVGANGCGKTTIIECLKYATTGALPPGAQSGQSFVHDPKIAGKSEVKGQIKLKFKNRVPMTMVCVRDLQLTQARSKMTYRALDAVVMTYKYDAEGHKTRTSITHKCTEMDRLMPELLGVPKFVLEHVVFCHQEDSNWPLQEGSKLKERFDQIFESARYTKALEDVRKQRKEKAAEHRLAKAEWEAVQVQVGRVHQLRRAVADADAQMLQLSDAITLFGTKIAEVDDILLEVKAIIERTEGLRAALRATEMQIEATQAHIQGLMLDVDELPPAEKDKVKRMLAMAPAAFEAYVGEIDERVRTVQQVIATKMRAITEKQAELSKQRARLSDLQSTAASKIVAQRQIDDLKAEFQRVAGTMSQFGVSYHGFAHSTAKSFMTQLGTAIRRLGDESAALASDHKRDVDAKQAQLDAHAAELNSTTSAMLSLTTRVETSNRELASVDAALRRLNETASADASQRLQGDIAALERQLTSANERIASGATRDAIARAEARVATLTSQSSALQAYVSHLRRHEKTQRRLEALRQSAGDARQAAETMLRDANGKFTSALGTSAAQIPLDALQRRMTAREARAQQEVESKKQATDAAAAALQREEAVHAAQRHTLVSACKRMEAAMTSLRAIDTSNRGHVASAAPADKVAARDAKAFRQRFSLLTVDDAAAATHFTATATMTDSVGTAAETNALPTMPEVITVDVLETRKTVAQRIEVETAAVSHSGDATAGLKLLAEQLRALSLADEDGHVHTHAAAGLCPACQRPFKSLTEATNAAAQLDELAREHEDAHASSKEVATRKRDAARALSVSYERAQPLVVEYHSQFAAAAEARDACNDAYNRIAHLRTAAQDAAEALRKATVDAKEMAELLRIAARIHEKWSEASEAETCIREEEEAMGEAPGAPLAELGVTAADADRVRTVDGCQGMLDDIQRDLTAQRSVISEEQKRELSAAAAVSELKAQIVARKSEYTRIEAAVKDRESARVRRAAAEREKAKAEAEKETLAGTIADINSNISRLKGELEAARRTERAMADSVIGKKSKMEQCQSRLSELLARFERSCLDAGVPLDPVPASSRSTAASSLDDASVADKVLNLETVIESLQAEEATLQEEVAAARSSADGESAARAFVATARQIAQLRVQLRKLGHNRDEQVEALAVEQHNEDPLESRQEALEARERFALERASAEGRLTEVKRQRDDNARELRRDDFATAEKRSAELLITAGTLEAAVKDLDRYASALDLALMQYHKLKIQEINNIIRDLWTNTYQGNDIDNIEIRSDLDDGAGEATAARSSRSYNYRVVMMKGDAELDMRGRCSAGQKVLASIIIRLALAETFCISTGLLALDEPTTNLDAPNKRGLARALARIIDLRRKTNSLQLIVITHDEDFVSELGRSMNDGGGSSSRAQLGEYWRVWREEVRPGVFHSRIERQELDV